MVKWGSSFRSQTSSLYLHLAERVRELHAKSFQSCPILCNPIDGSPPSSPLPRILQARTLERVAISFSNTWKWSHSVVSDPRRPHGLQPSRLLYPWDFPGNSTGLGCRCLLPWDALYELWSQWWRLTWPKCLWKAPAPNVITMGCRCSTYVFWEEQTFWP